MLLYIGISHRRNRADGCVTMVAKSAARSETSPIEND